jgi:acyl carrier protein
MTSDTLAMRVRQVVANTLNLPLDQVPDDACAESFPGWDSMAHLMLVLSLEQEFSRQFSPADVERMKSVRAIVALLDGSQGGG